MRNNLKIGLSYYEEERWIAAIKKYGKSIMDKSQLSPVQKSILASEEIARLINRASY